MRFSISLLTALFAVSVSAAGTGPRLGRPADRVELPPGVGQSGRDRLPPPLIPAPGPVQQPAPIRFQKIANIQIEPQVFRNHQGVVRYDNIPSELLTTPVDVDLLDAQFRQRLINNLDLKRFSNRAFRLTIQANISVSPDNSYFLQFVDEKNNFFYESNSFAFAADEVTTLGQEELSDEAASPIDLSNDGVSPSQSNNTPIQTPTPTPVSSPGPASPSSTDDSDPPRTNGAVVITLASVLYRYIVLSGMAMTLAYAIL